MRFLMTLIGYILMRCLNAALRAEATGVTRFKNYGANAHHPL